MSHSLHFLTHCPASSIAEVFGSQRLKLAAGLLGQLRQERLVVRAVGAFEGNYVHLDLPLRILLGDEIQNGFLIGEVAGVDQEVDQLRLEREGFLQRG